MRPYSAVIAHWNGARMLSDALHSLHAQTYPPSEIIVVDNGSRDASRALVREVFPDVTLLANTENLGFATANNQGIAHALRDPKITALLTMNNDVVADARLGELLMTALEQHPHIGGVQAKMRFPGTPARIFSAGGFIADDNFRMVNRGYGEADIGQFDAPEEIFAPCAGTALYRRACLEDTVLADGAFFDPAYFAYLEDVDLACRGHLRGWRFLYEPRAIVYHHEAATSRRLPAAAKEYLSRRNRLWTAAKTLPPGLCAKVLLRYALPSLSGVVFAPRDPRAPALSADIRATIRALVDTAWTLPSLLRARKRIQARAKSPEALAAWFRAPRVINLHAGLGGAPRQQRSSTQSGNSARTSRRRGAGV